MTGVAVMFFSIVGFWKWDKIVSAVAFLMAAGCSAMLAYSWFNTFGTNSSLGVSLMLFGYTIFCIGMVYRGLFLGRRDGR